MFERLLQNMDEDTASNLLNKLNDEQIEQGLEVAVEDFIVPHVEEIRTTSRDQYESRHKVREVYGEMDPQDQQEVFDEAWADMVAVGAQIREQPQRGMLELKQRLRDPWTMEALLLIFDNEDHIDEEYSEEMKEFTTFAVRWMAVNMLPEMYTQEEVEVVVEELFGEQDYEAVMAEYGLEVE